MNIHTNQLPSSPYVWHFSDFLIQVTNSQNKAPECVKTPNSVLILIRKQHCSGSVHMCIELAGLETGEPGGGMLRLSQLTRWSRSAQRRALACRSPGFEPGQCHLLAGDLGQIAFLSKVQMKIEVLKWPYQVVVQRGTITGGESSCRMGSLPTPPSLLSSYLREWMPHLLTRAFGPSVIVYLARNISLHPLPPMYIPGRIHSLYFYGNTTGFHYNHWDLGSSADCPHWSWQFKGDWKWLSFQGQEITEYREACVLWKEID